MEYDEAMKEYRDNWAAVQVSCKCWIRWEQVEDARRSANAARAQAEADRLWHEAAERTRKQVRVKSPGDKLTRSCGRCMVKGKSFGVQPLGRLCLTVSRPCLPAQGGWILLCRVSHEEGEVRSDPHHSWGQYLPGSP